MITATPLPPLRTIRAPSFNRENVTSLDRKSTRLNSSHSQISYAVFCLKKKQPRPCARCAGTSSPTPGRQFCPEPDRCLTCASPSASRQERPDEPNGLHRRTHTYCNHRA